MVKQTLTLRQATMWFSLHQFGSAMLILPSVLTGIAKQDAWLSVPLSIGFFILLIPLYGAIAKQLNGASFEDHLMNILGSFCGKIVICGFVLLFPYAIFMLSLRDLGDFLATSIFPETPQAAIYVLMLGSVYYVVRLGASVVGRTAEILFFLVFSLFLIVSLSLLYDIDLRNIQPIFEGGMPPIFHASVLLLTFPYMESVIFLFLVSHVDQVNKWKKALMKSAVISGSAFLIMTLLCILSLSEDVVSRITYPSYFVVRTININDFYERFEILISIIWYIAIFFRLSLFLFVTVQGLGGAFRLKYPRALLIPLCLIALIMAKVVYPNKANFMSLLKVWPYYAIIVGFLFPLAIWGIGSIRKPKEKTC